jgi:hypothetical protein
MRFASAHKLVTYLLVLAALAAVASTRARASAPAVRMVSRTGCRHTRGSVRRVRWVPASNRRTDSTSSPSSSRRTGWW